MSETKAPQVKTNKLIQSSLILIFCIALLRYVQNIQHQEILPYLPIFLILTLLIGVGIGLFQRCRRPLRDSFKTPLFLAFNAFGFVALLSTFYSIYPFLTFSRSLQYLIAANSLYFILWHSNDIRRSFELIAKLLIYFVLIAALYGLILRYFGSVEWVYGNHSEYPKITKPIRFYYLRLLGVDLTQLLYGDRISSFTGNPNTIGFPIMISSLLSLYFVVEKKKYHYLLYTAISLYVLFLAESRASILGLATGLFIYCYLYFIQRHQHGRVILTTFLALVALSVGLFMFNESVYQTVLSITGRDSALSNREIAWAAFIGQIRETPWLGIGYKISTESILHSNNIDIKHSHNLYLTVLSEIGLVGFAIFLFIFLFPFVRYFSNRAKDSPNNNLLFTCLAVLGAFLIHQGFEDMFRPLEFPFLFIFLILFVVYCLISDESPEKPARYSGQHTGR